MAATEGVYREGTRWRDLASDLRTRNQRHNVSLMAAGIAFYGLLSIAPLLTAVVALYGLFFNAADVTQQVDDLSSALPQGSETIVRDQLANVATSGTGALSLSVAISILIAIYSATRGVTGLMMALNVAHEEYERRGIIQFYATAYALTATAILLIVVALASIVIAPIVIEVVGLSGLSNVIVSTVRWPILAAMFCTALIVIYRFGPTRSLGTWRALVPGAALATGLWLLGSVAFSLYVRLFAHYGQTYGSLGAVVILLMWFWLSGYIVLLGAEMNALLLRRRRARRLRHAGRPAAGAGVGEPAPQGRAG
ncbi:YihY/virulence factor BrkB family protein [Marinivivus vitaminiproducens]|uniref:YihY/virulence factor BrkB family protein n=1 Tax=Marinivivus vitaminiproducens TaxID=3035935 RepID=UPI0027A32E8E|nr:YihY/virulence factor BrkB family protein [Geminicoccaceae bacterium SCSIO 64248]